MASRLGVGYMLFVDSKPMAANESLEVVKQVARAYIPNMVPLRIEGMAAPAPTRVWNYDHGLQEWVERG